MHFQRDCIDNAANTAPIRHTAARFGNPHSLAFITSAYTNAALLRPCFVAPLDNDASAGLMIHDSPELFSYRNLALGAACVIAYMNYSALLINHSRGPLSYGLCNLSYNCMNCSQGDGVAGVTDCARVRFDGRFLEVLERGSCRSFAREVLLVYIKQVDGCWGGGGGGGVMLAGALVLAVGIIFLRNSLTFSFIFMSIETSLHL